MLDFTYNSDNIKVQKGDLLISEPFIPDPNFSRTVVLLCEHNEVGSFGFVLNKQSLLQGKDVLEGADVLDSPLYVGGPVQQDTLHFLHREENEELGGEAIIDGLRWGGNFSKLLSGLETKLMQTSDFKFFLGYSGWDAGQLEEELNQNSWIVYQGTTATDIFDTDPDALWRQILQRMGGRYKMISNYPTDPRLN
jgi:putative transcriptional regulator